MNNKSARDHELELSTPKGRPLPHPPGIGVGVPKSPVSIREIGVSIPTPHDSRRLQTNGNEPPQGFWHPPTGPPGGMRPATSASRTETVGALAAETAAPRLLGPELQTMIPAQQPLSAPERRGFFDRFVGRVTKPKNLRGLDLAGASAQLPRDTYGVRINIVCEGVLHYGQPRARRYDFCLV